MVQLNTLMQIAAFGGVAAVGTGIYLHRTLQNKVRNSEVFQEVMHRVLNNKGAVTLLGDPLKFGTINTGNAENYCYIDKAQIQVPIKGSKCNGILEFMAEKKSTDTEWTFNKIEIEIKDRLGGRLNILKQQLEN